MSMLSLRLIFTVGTLLVDIPHKQRVSAQNYQLTSSCGGSVQAGGNCTLMCYTGEASHTTIVWQNGTLLYRVNQGSCSSTSLQLPADYTTSCPSSTNYNLTINNVVYGRDRLRWSCDYQFGGRPSNQIQMDVLVPLNSVTLTRTTTSISCVAVSNPPPSITLYRDGASVAISPAAVEGYTGWTANINYQLTGNSRNSLYYCQASSTQSTVNSTSSYPGIAVNRVSLTNITSTNQEVGAAEGQPLALTCVTSASYPAATITWYKNSVLVKSGISVDHTPQSGVVQTTSTMTFNPVRGDLGHTVYCRATNIHNPSPVRSDSARIGVWYPPPVPPSITQFPDVMFEGDTQTISCSVTGGNPLATITWSCPGTGSASVSDSGQTRTSTLSFTVSRSQNGQQCQCLGAWQYGGYNFSDVRTFNVSCPSNPEPLKADCNMTGVIVGATIGTLLVTLLIEGLVLTVLYRKGFRFGNIFKGSALPKSTRNPETDEMENTAGYSSLDHINSSAQSSSMDTGGSERQHYTQLKVYENTNVEAKAEASTYEDMTETPPTPYESISASPYQNSGSQP
ncbi:B-cell receptor CD22-like isoform X5 [Haliotis rubra]|uniref:B-cell receptor CD22-like isoform X5 n=1 Tax=Haliotis rubra TaxID=36100 RepID=UPI001EE624C2|nr:B-cell receptor CD22-like isoform X5 [Haliotis rubra]